MALTLERETTEYVYVGITGEPVTEDVEVAFLDAESRPDEEDWETAVKVDDSEHALWSDATASGSSGDWFIAKLVGPFGSGAELTPGDYQVWVRAEDTDERPVRQVGVLTIN